MLRLFWHCMAVEKGDRDFVSAAFQQLTNLLQRPPVEVELQVAPLAKEFAGTVTEELKHPSGNAEYPLTGYFEAIQSKLPQISLWTPLLIYCDRSTAIAQACMRANPSHLWGSTWCPFISAAYTPNNKYLLWHEAFHLWQARDCYSKDNPNGPTTCELPNCIMQYAPSEETVGGWPFICQDNVNAIRCCSEKPPPRTM